MLRAIGEVEDIWGEVVAYILQDEEGNYKEVKNELIIKALKLKRVQISNLKVTGNRVEYKGVHTDDRMNYGVLDEGEYWGVINRLPRNNIGAATKQLNHLLKYKMPLEWSIRFCNRSFELHQRLGNAKEDDIADFMRSALGRCSDDQIIDFIYCIIWIGKPMYYKFLKSKSVDNLLKDLRCDFGKLNVSGEMFGYVCGGTSGIINYW